VKLVVNIIAIAIVSCLVNSCASINPGNTSAKKNSYSEDLSAFRPEAPVSGPPTVDTTSATFITDTTALDVSERLNTVLDTAASYARSTIKYIDGFTIQVYGGDNRTVARNYKSDLLRNFPETKPKMVFEQPNYKVRVGSYYSRLEAQHFFIEVKEVFPKAILIPTRLSIKGAANN